MSSFNFKQTIINNLLKKGNKEKNEHTYNKFVLFLKNSGLSPDNFLQKLFEIIPSKIALKKISKREEQIRLLPTNKQIKLACSKLIKNQNLLKNAKEIADLESNTIKVVLNEKKKLYREGSRLV